MRPEMLCGLLALVPTSCVLGQLSFSDQTDDAGLTFRHQVSQGYPGMHVEMIGGGTVGDFNRDGRPDVFVPGGGATPDRLFINTGSPSPWFQDEAASWGVAAEHRSAGSAVGDFNRDGWDDLYVVSYGDSAGASGSGRCRLYRNNGNGTFTDVAVEAGVNAVSPARDGLGAAWGDYDLDGNLDLFVSTWSLVAGGNRLFRNNGDGTFTDATLSASLDTDTVQGFTPRFADMNGDRLPELLLTNDFHTSRYYINNGDGTFTDHTSASGITHDCNGMGSTLIDVNGDGLLDWYMTNIYRSISSNPCGNVLYLNQGNHVFTEVAEALSIRDGGWGWGTTAADLDNDGDVDLLETSGWRTYANRPARVYLNNDDMTFSSVAGSVGLDYLDQGRGLAHLDYDLDGDIDAIFFTNQGDLRLFRNDLGPGPSWIDIAVDTSRHPCLAPGGYGTRIELDAGGRTQVRYVDGSYTYLGQSEMIAHFGLGDATEVDEVRLMWADGTISVRSAMALNQRHVVSAYHVIDTTHDGTLDTRDVITMLNAFASGSLDADFDADGVVEPEDVVAFLLAFQQGC